MSRHPAIDGLLTTLATGESKVRELLGAPARRPGTGLGGAFRWARVVSRRAANRYRRRKAAGVPMEHLLQAGIVRQPEPGEYYLDEAAMDDWMNRQR